MADIRNNLPQGLLNDVKNYCDITWTDTATDNKVAQYIANGITYLMDKLGIEDTAEFLNDGYPRSLLLDYVRYARDNATEVFETNFRSYLIGAQNERMVAFGLG